MAKNSTMLQALKVAEKQIKMELINIYGALAIVLHRIGIPSDQIVAMFEMTEDLWNEAIQKDVNMADWAAEEAGVNIYMLIEKKGDKK